MYVISEYTIGPFEKHYTVGATNAEKNPQKLSFFRVFTMQMSHDEGENLVKITH